MTVSSLSALSGPRSSSGTDTVGVVGDEPDRLERYAEPFVDQLGEAGFVALSAVHRPEHQLGGPVGLDRDLRPLARCATVHLDVVGNPDPAQQPATGRLGATAAEALPIREFERAVHAIGIFAVVVGDADRIGVGHGLRGDQIPAPQRDAIEAVLGRGQVDQSFDDIDRLGTAGATIRRGRRRVRHDGAAAEINGWNGVHALHDAEALA